MNKTEIIETILLKITRDPEFWRQYGTHPHDIGDLLKAGDASYEARALHAIKSWVTADERVFFYAVPQVNGIRYMAHMGADNDFYVDDKVVGDSEYWALAATLARAIRDNHFPIQENVLGDDLDVDGTIDSLQEQLDGVMSINKNLAKDNNRMIGQLEKVRLSIKGIDKIVCSILGDFSRSDRE